MIHYSCDLCKRELKPSDDARYVVRIEMIQEIDSSSDAEPVDDRDYLDEMQDILEQMSDSYEELSDALGKTHRFDLCPECARKFAKNPLGRELKQFDFSKN